MDSMNAHTPICSMLSYALVILSALLIPTLSFGQGNDKALPKEAEAYYLPPEIMPPWCIVTDLCVTPLELLNNKWVKRINIKNTTHLKKMMVSSDENFKENDCFDGDLRFVIILKYDKHADTVALSYSEQVDVLFNKKSFFSPEYYLNVIKVLNHYDWRLRFYSQLYFYDNQYQSFPRENCLQRFISRELRTAWYRDYVRAMKKEDPDFEDYYKGVLYH